MVDNEAITFARDYLNKNLLLEFIRRSKPTEGDLLCMDEAMEAAAKNPDTNDFDAITTVAVDLLREGERMPAWLAAFVADILEGNRKRPVKPGQDPYKHWERDYKLWQTTLAVSERFDLPAYTNNELSDKSTAADAVAAAAGVGADVVKNACKKMKKLGAK